MASRWSAFLLHIVGFCERNSILLAIALAVLVSPLTAVIACSPSQESMPPSVAPSSSTPQGSRFQTLLDCGTIQLLDGAVVNDPAAGIAGSCFLQAFKDCKYGSRLKIINNIDSSIYNTTDYSVDVTETGCLIAVVKTGGITLSQPLGTPVVGKGVPPTGGTCADVMSDSVGILHFLGCVIPIRDTDVPTMPVP